MTRPTCFLLCSLTALVSGCGVQGVFATGGLTLSPPGGKWQDSLITQPKLQSEQTESMKKMLLPRHDNHLRLGSDLQGLADAFSQSASSPS
jgi:hypothetical protein